MAGASPTRRSMDYLRARGWLPGKVEHWNPHVGQPGPDGKPQGIRQDLWGVIDIVALKVGEPVVFVQTTTASNVAARVEKICASKHFAVIARTGRIEVHGWKKVGARWTVRVLELGPERITVQLTTLRAVAKRRSRQQELFDSQASPDRLATREPDPTRAPADPAEARRHDMAAPGGAPGAPAGRARAPTALAQRREGG